MTNWLAPLERTLAAATEPVTFFFRDDDAGWADDALVRLLELFARRSLPLDLAVIPTALDPRLAEELRRRVEASPFELALHQHGYAHVNHEPEGRAYEFGPSRNATAQRADLHAGCQRLRQLLGELAAPIFTPPWNRCTSATASCLAELGFRALSRDATAEPIETAGLREFCVDIDWQAHRRGVRVSLAELGERTATAARKGGPVGLMLHHAVMAPADFAEVDRLLDVIAAHPNARCRTMASLVKLEGAAAQY